MGKNYANIAGLSLLAASTGFVASLPFQGNLAGQLVHAASEAALVGGIADWYAVTALFRHPLGQKWIPHTAIIPKNRQRIIDGIVDMVENEWLTKEIIKEKIQQVHLIDILLGYVDKRESREYLVSLMASFVQGMADQLNPKELAEFLNNLIHTEGTKIPLTPHLAKLLQWARENGYDDKTFDFLLAEGKKLINQEKCKPIIAAAIKKAAQEFISGGGGGMMAQFIAPILNTLNFEDLAASVQKMILEYLDQQADDYRSKFKDFMIYFLGRLQTDQALEEIIEDWKNQALQKVSFTESVAQAILSIKNSDLFSGSGLRNYLHKLLNEQINSLREDQEKRDQLENWIKEQIYQFVEEKHSHIGRLVKTNLDKLDEETFVTVIEERVGTDLQWIRVNGAVVGGMIGIALYLLKHFIL